MDGTFGNSQSATMNASSPGVFEGLKIKPMNADFNELNSDRTSARNSQAEMDRINS